MTTKEFAPQFIFDSHQEYNKINYDRNHENSSIPVHNNSKFY